MTALGKGADGANDPTPKLRVLNAHESSHQRVRIRGRQEVGDVTCGSPLSPLRPMIRPFCGPLEKEMYRNIKHLGNPLQSASADAIDAILVFLHLLKRDAKPISKAFLAHTELEPSHADAVA